MHWLSSQFVSYPKHRPHTCCCNFSAHFQKLFFRLCSVERHLLRFIRQECILLLTILFEIQPQENVRKVNWVVFRLQEFSSLCSKSQVVEIFKLVFAQKLHRLTLRRRDIFLFIVSPDAVGPGVKQSRPVHFLYKKMERTTRICGSDISWL